MSNPQYADGLAILCALVEMFVMGIVNLVLGTLALILRLGYGIIKTHGSKPESEVIIPEIVEDVNKQDTIVFLTTCRYIASGNNPSAQTCGGQAPLAFPAGNCQPLPTSARVTIAGRSDNLLASGQ